MGAERIVDKLNFTNTLFKPESRTTTGTLFNGASTGAAVAIDTRDADEAVITINTGTFSGSASVAFQVYESATEYVTPTIAVTGAAFTTVTSANDEAKQVGFIRTAGRERYLWLRSNKTGTTDSALWSADIVLGKLSKNPPSNSAVFNV